jgi:hypothetical protein
MRYSPSPPLLLLRRFVRSIEFNGFRGALTHSFQRFYRSLRQHGPGGVFARAFIKAPVLPVANPPEPRPPHPFDVLHGTDTGGFISGANMPAATLSAIYTTVCLGIAPSALQSALAALPVKYEDFTFVDVGCGKGRALLIAAEFPFQRLVGIEITSELSRVSQANLALFPQWKDRISVVNQDAVRFVYPDTPLVLFLYNPFLTPVFRRVLANLVRQLRQSPRRVYLLFADIYADLDRLRNDKPVYAAVMDSFSSITNLSESIYHLNAEELAVEPSRCTVNRISLYSIDVTR